MEKEEGKEGIRRKKEGEREEGHEEKGEGEEGIRRRRKWEEGESM